MNERNIRKAEVRKQNVESRIPEWWVGVPAAEKAVIRDVIGMIRGLKRSRSVPVAEAARKWERGLTCFIKFRLMGERPRPRARAISSPTSGRSQPDASRAQG